MKPIDHQSNAVTTGIAERARNLELSGRAGIEYASARDADRHILSSAPATYLDATKFDSVRFSPPDWAQETLAAAAADGSLAYNGYRGDRNVLDKVAKNVSSLLGIAIDPARQILLTAGTQAGLFGARP